MKCKNCNKHNPRKIDYCMQNLSNFLAIAGFKVKASCCGHGKYPMTIVYYSPSIKQHFELISGILIKRKKRFYLKDKEGFYYIPETI